MINSSFFGMKVLVMGLGLNGGGVESAIYLAGRGADVTVTDLRDENILAPSIQKLAGFSVRYVLGRHEMEDFRNADLVIKNPGVRPDSPFLKAARRIETDISLFLTANPARLFAVTGTKGKSSVSSALHHVLAESRTAGLLNGEAWLGGNITRSPLSFLDKLKPGDDVVLELSSWQLGDIRGKNILKPRAAVITPIMKDHLDMYGSMEAYVNDKRLIYQNQNKEDVTVAADDEWGRSFLKETNARPLMYSTAPPASSEPSMSSALSVSSSSSASSAISCGWINDPKGPAYVKLEGHSTPVEIVPAELLVPGIHQKQNLLATALALLDIGLEPEFIKESLGRFHGVEHRLEFFHESGGVKFYNDTAATIPEAAAAAISAFDSPPVLVTGGTDKELDFSPLARAANNAKTVILLSGSGTEKLKLLLDAGGIKYKGPYDSLDGVIEAVSKNVKARDTVVLSPGCASFGMFVNEFDRGNKWKEAIKKAFS